MFVRYVSFDMRIHNKNFLNSTETTVNSRQRVKWTKKGKTGNEKKICKDRRTNRLTIFNNMTMESRRHAKQVPSKQKHNHKKSRIAFLSRLISGHKTEKIFNKTYFKHFYKN